MIFELTCLVYANWLYFWQVHEMAMVSSIQEAQKDNLRSFNEYMMQVLEVRMFFLGLRIISNDLNILSWSLIV